MRPLKYGQKSASTLEKAYKAITICQNEADLKQTNNNLPKFKTIQINPGDYVYVKRDQSVAAKTDHSIWIGPYKVLSVRDCVIEILKENDSKDYVHRVHVCLKIERQDQLISNIKLPEPVPNIFSNHSNTFPSQMLENNNYFRPIRNRCPTTKIQIQPKKKSYD